MMRTVRQDSLLEYLRGHGPATVQELAAHLSSSPATVRRDLEHLASLGQLERTWGGARLAVQEDDLFAEARLHHGEAKAAIAEVAAGLVPDHASVLVDVGTTTHYVAELLRHRPLTVITASLPVFEVLKDSPETHLVLLGGDHSPHYQCLEGPLTADNVAQVSADVALLGCSGLDERGQVRDTSAGQVPVKRAMVAAARRRILLADPSKFPGHGSHVAIGLAEVDVLITQQPSPGLLALCDATHTEVRQP